MNILEMNAKILEKKKQNYLTAASPKDADLILIRNFQMLSRIKNWWCSLDQREKVGHLVVQK